jgi:monovalent cation:proton antiporter-2 (CPA2) family protein
MPTRALYWTAASFWLLLLLGSAPFAVSGFSRQASVSKAVPTKSLPQSPFAASLSMGNARFNRVPTLVVAPPLYAHEVVDAEWFDDTNNANNADIENDPVANNNNTNSNSNSNKMLQRSADKCRALSSKIRRRMQLLLVWQRSKGRTLLAAAALAFTVLLSSHSTLVPQHASTQSPASTAVERVMPPRGGSGSGAAAVSSSSGNKMSWLQRGEEQAMQKMEQAVEVGMATAGTTTGRTLLEAAQDLSEYMRGTKSDTLLLLLATALITPLCKRLGTSPILGFLAAGMLMGPNGWGLISGIHTTETLAELGIVFFLFEMGIELSMERLLSMRKDVFGLGLCQFVVTALAVAGVGGLVGLPGNALVVLGGGLALSSSAFVLQLLKDKSQLATRFGKASFGILLFQDLAVVPLLVVTPILAGTGGGLVQALGSAVVKAAMALGSIAFAGRVLVNPLFKYVAKAQSQEAFLGVILLTVLSMSFLTEGLGLSNTLGAFLAGVLLSETNYRYQVEADIAPFRGVLLGLFFVTVGFEIDVGLIASNLPLVGSIVTGIILIKAITTTALSLLFGLSLSTSQQTGLILSQGGEFAFVAFGLARSLGILDTATTKLMLTSVSLTMALTPLLASLGQKVAKRLEEQSDFTHYLGQDRDANEIKESDDFVVVVGYGVVGKVVCDLLDRKFIKYVGLDTDPNKAIQARNSGLPVFYGDIGRQEVADAFNVGKAKAVVVCIAEKAQCNRVAIALRRFYPELKIFARAADADHASRLQNTLNVVAMVPILPEDNLLLTLPFASAVMKSLGVPAEEVNAITEAKRKEVLSGRGLDENEEETALLQLGIAAPAPPVKKKTSVAVEEASKSGEKEEKEEDDDKAKGDKKSSSRKKSAKERASAAREKSPFVAQVIEEVCPGSVTGDGDDMDAEKPDFAAQLVQQVANNIKDADMLAAAMETDRAADRATDKVTEIDKDIVDAAAMKNETESTFQ